MTKTEFKKLKEGDIITSASGHGYIVTQRVSDTEFIAVRTMSVSNPSEWRLAKKK